MAVNSGTGRTFSGQYAVHVRNLFKYGIIDTNADYDK